MADDGRLGEVGNVAVRKKRGLGDGVGDGSKPRAEHDADCGRQGREPGLQICGCLRNLVVVCHRCATGRASPAFYKRPACSRLAARELTADNKLLQSTWRLDLARSSPAGIFIAIRAECAGWQSIAERELTPQCRRPFSSSD